MGVYIVIIHNLSNGYTNAESLSGMSIGLILLFILSSDARAFAAHVSSKPQRTRPKGLGQEQIGNIAFVKRLNRINSRLFPSALHTSHLAIPL